MGNRLRHRKFHDIVGNQLERPATPARRRGTAGNPRHLGFHPTIQRNRAPTARRVVEQLEFGTQMVWVLDPETESVAVYRRDKQPYLVKKEQELTGDDVLPDFRCQVAEFFALPGQ